MCFTQGLGGFDNYVHFMVPFVGHSFVFAFRSCTISPKLLLDNACISLPDEIYDTSKSSQLQLKEMNGKLHIHCCRLYLLQALHIFYFICFFFSCNSFPSKEKLSLVANNKSHTRTHLPCPVSCNSGLLCVSIQGRFRSFFVVTHYSLSMHSCPSIYFGSAGRHSPYTSFWGALANKFYCPFISRTSSITSAHLKIAFT